jgi:hypothetical protein
MAERGSARKANAPENSGIWQTCCDFVTTPRQPKYAATSGAPPPLHDCFAMRLMGA